MNTRDIPPEISLTNILLTSESVCEKAVQEDKSLFHGSLSVFSINIISPEQSIATTLSII